MRSAAGTPIRILKTIKSQVLWNAASLTGTEARPFFKLATDLSSIFKERAEIVAGGTRTRGSNRYAPFDSAFT